MGFQSVWVCDEHWQEEEGRRPVHHLIPEGVTLISGSCYRCGEEAVIPVRRFIDGAPTQKHLTPDDAA